MGADLYWLDKRVRSHNGSLMNGLMRKFKEILYDDEPFKVERLKRLYEEYEKQMEEI